MKRGDVVLVRFPHPSGQRGKKRPAVVVQSDTYAGAVSTVVVAEVTKNLTMKGDPACLFIDVTHPTVKQRGFLSLRWFRAWYSIPYTPTPFLRCWGASRRRCCGSLTIA